MNEWVPNKFPGTKILDERYKLPICPRCNSTKVKELRVLSLLYVHEVYPWFECPTCGIKWHASQGIREKGDQTPCFG